jgi:hypothetical protein
MSNWWVLSFMKLVIYSITSYSIEFECVMVEFIGKKLPSIVAPIFVAMRSWLA